MEVVDLLKDKIPKEKIKHIPRSWDILGDICIIKLNEEVKEHDKTIGKAIMKIHKNVNSVYEKVEPVSGVYRTAKHRWVCGEKKTETLYKEHGCKVKLDINKVYFSPRLSNERKRIAKKIKKNEKILLMFAGVGIYAFVICKYQPKVKIYAIEINPAAYEYMIKNIKLNRFQKEITPIKGDVKEKVPELKGKFDRIIMPLPENAEEFLDITYNKIRSNGIIHYYDFGEEPNLFRKSIKLLKRKSKNNKKEIEILEKTKCGQYAPGKYRICLDLLIK